MTDERFNPDLCNGCGTCVDICPNDVLRMDEEKGIATVRYPEDCSFCGFCYANCPTGAITDAPGVMRRPLVAW